MRDPFIPPVQGPAGSLFNDGLLIVLEAPDILQMPADLSFVMTLVAAGRGRVARRARPRAETAGLAAAC
jgi:hypothetical protein